jgi:hypothetical protein
MIAGTDACNRHLCYAYVPCIGGDGGGEHGIYAWYRLVYTALLMCDALCIYMSSSRDVMGCPATQAQHRRVRVQHRGRGGSYADSVPFAQAGGGRYLLGALHEPLLGAEASARWRATAHRGSSGHALGSHCCDAALRGAASLRGVPGQGGCRCVVDAGGHVLPTSCAGLCCWLRMAVNAITEAARGA